MPGGQWWLNRAVKGAPAPWPDVAETAFAALGHWGQALYVLPEEKLVIVRYADDRDGRFRHNEFLRLAQAAFAGRRGHDPSSSLALPVRPGAARRPRVAWQNRIHLAAFPAIIGAYTAKEYCSCRYVMGNSADYCRAYTQQYVPISGFFDDEARRRVTARGLGSTQTAAWLGPREGCRLMPEADRLPD